MLFEFTIIQSNISPLKYVAHENHPNRNHQINMRNPSITAGSYPEIDAHLNSVYGTVHKIGVQFVPSLGDTFVQATGTWTYQRAPNTIIVHDVVRTVMIISSEGI